MNFEILISTYGAEGINRLARDGALPHIEGVTYLISWQRGNCVADIPQSLFREDVRVVIALSIGSGANRANAIVHAKGDWCMIADDDLVFDVEGIKEMMKRLEAHSELDFALGQSNGGDAKLFPLSEYDVFPLAKNHFVTEFEIVVRLQSLRKAGINFNSHFGVGKELRTGEGAVLLYEMKRNKLRGRYFPIVLACHPGLTTSERVALDGGVLKAEGVIVALNYPFTGLLRVPLMVWRRSRRFGGSFFRSLPHAYRGFMRGIFGRKSLGIGE